MQIVFTRTALKQLQKIAPRFSRAIREKIAQYAENPVSLANQVKRLQGSPFYRLRVGDYRIIFSEDGTILTIIKVGHRREVYN
jgi:mRNA interferase RelE/StbE